MSSIILLRLSISLLRLLIFSFVVVSSTFFIAHWSIIMVALKSLSNNCNMSIILMLASIDCLFSFSWRCSWFWVCRVTFNWNLNFLCVRRFWILFKPFGLAGFIWHCSGRGTRGGVSPCYCQVGADVQVPCSACTDIQGGSTIVLSWGGGSSSPGRVHWLSAEVGLIIAG